MPVTQTYAAWWPITDDSATLSELSTEALDDLARLAAQDGLILAGQPRFGVQPGEEPVLMALADVRPIYGGGQW